MVGGWIEFWILSHVRARSWYGFHGVFGGGGTRLAMPNTILRVGLIVIEDWFRGYWGSPGLGGPGTAGLYAYVGLFDYEDTRLKTSSRVRV